MLIRLIKLLQPLRRVNDLIVMCLFYITGEPEYDVTNYESRSLKQEFSK
jgi:hypothetical protein